MDGDRLNMDTNAKYLRITIHDNDFWYSLEMIGELLYQLFNFEEKYPTEEQLPLLKEYIKYMWYGTYAVKGLMLCNKPADGDIDYFEPHLEFVDYFDIPEWDNRESIYIPMFDNAEILVR